MRNIAEQNQFVVFDGGSGLMFRDKDQVGVALGIWDGRVRVELV